MASPQATAPETAANIDDQRRPRENTSRFDWKIPTANRTAAAAPMRGSITGIAVK
jgi:hypothetical protein